MDNKFFYRRNNSRVVRRVGTGARCNHYVRGLILTIAALLPLPAMAADQIMGFYVGIWNDMRDLAVAQCQIVDDDPSISYNLAGACSDMFTSGYGAACGTLANCAGIASSGGGSCAYPVARVTARATYNGEDTFMHWLWCGNDTHPHRDCAHYGYPGDPAANGACNGTDPDDDGVDQCDWPANGLEYSEVDWASCDVPADENCGAADLAVLTGCDVATDPYGCCGPPPGDACDPLADPFGCAPPDPQLDPLDEPFPTACPSGYIYSDGGCVADASQGDASCPYGTYRNPATGLCDSGFDPESPTTTTTSSTTTTTTTETVNGDGSTTAVATTEEEETEEDTMIIPGNCNQDQPPRCTGDPIQCYIALQNYETRCQLSWDPADIQTVADAIGTDDPAVLENPEVDLSTGFDPNRIAAFPDSCPNVDPIVVLGTSIDIPTDYFCDAADIGSFLILASAYFLGLRLVIGAL